MGKRVHLGGLNRGQPSRKNRGNFSEDSRRRAEFRTEYSPVNSLGRKAGDNENCQDQTPGAGPCSWMATGYRSCMSVLNPQRGRGFRTILRSDCRDYEWHGRAPENKPRSRRLMWGGLGTNADSWQRGHRACIDQTEIWQHSREFQTA
jgi:hypothetical protein